MRFSFQHGAVRRGVGVGLAVALAFVSRRAVADAPVRAVARVDAPPDCATDAMFWTAVAHHTPGVLEGRGDGIPAIDIAVHTEGDRAVGELRITRAGEASLRRRLAGASCGEVVDGLGLIVALAFDPAALSRPERPEPVAPAIVAASTTEPEAPASGAAMSVVPVVTPPAPVRPEDVRPWSREQPAPAPTLPSAARWRVAAGALAGAAAQGAANIGLAYGAFLEVAREKSGISPSLRLGLQHSTGEVTSGDAGADLSWTVARASVCPLRVDLRPSISLRPCAGLEAGALTASAYGLLPSLRRTRPWVAPGASGQVRWSPGQTLFVEGEVALGLPLVRDEYLADPEEPLYRPPTVVAMTTLAAGVRFW